MKVKLLQPYLGRELVEAFKKAATWENGKWSRMAKESTTDFQYELGTTGPIPRTQEVRSYPYLFETMRRYVLVGKKEES